VSPFGITWIGIFACSSRWFGIPNGFPRETSAEIPDWFQAHRPHDQGIWVEGIHHFVEKKSQGVGLNPEDFFPHGIALIC
jgi:hypothetical protein